jgi:preprotein translocase subunit SecG
MSVSLFFAIFIFLFIIGIILLDYSKKKQFESLWRTSDQWSLIQKEDE